MLGTSKDLVFMSQGDFQETQSCVKEFLRIPYDLHAMKCYVIQ